MAAGAVSVPPPGWVPPRHGRAAGTPQPDTTGMIMNNTSRRHGIPPWILWGIFGAESSFGKSGNWFGLVAVPRSTYGVDGTGHHYDSGGKATFSGDADQAAKTIKGLLTANNGNVERALMAYSGNGYQDVAKQHKLPSATAYIAKLATQAPLHVDVPISTLQKIAAGPVGDAVAAAASPFEALGRIADLLTSSEFWIRLGEAILGIALLLMGLRSLTGEATTPASIARSVRAVAR